jgi:hypothetical protein
MRCSNGINNCVFVDKKLVVRRPEWDHMCHYAQSTKLGAEQKRGPWETPSWAGRVWWRAHCCTDTLCASSSSGDSHLPSLSSDRCYSAILTGSMFSPGRRQMAAQSGWPHPGHLFSQLLSLRGSQVCGFPKPLPAGWEVRGWLRVSATQQWVLQPSECSPHICLSTASHINKTKPWISLGVSCFLLFLTSFAAL